MNRNLLLITVALLLWGLGEGMFYSFVPIYLDNQFLLDIDAIGWALGAYGFAMAITHIPAGWLADRVGRRPLLIFAWVLGLISALVMGLSRSLPLFLVGYLGYGLTAFVASPLSSYTTAARGEWSVGRVLSFTTAAYGMGMVFGPVTGGWVGERYGMRISFFAAAAAFLLSNAFIIFIEKQPIDHHDPESPPPSLRSNRHFIALMGVLAFAMFSMYLAQPLTPNFLEGVRGLPLSEMGIIFAVGALGNSLMAILFSRAHPRHGFVFAQGLVILFALLIWKGSNLPVFALGYFLLGGFRAGRPMVQAQARDLVHDSQMGVTYGVIETITSIVLVLTPPVAGMLFKRDPMIVYPLSIGLLVISILVSYLFSPRKAVYA